MRGNKNSYEACDKVFWTYWESKQLSLPASTKPEYIPLDSHPHEDATSYEDDNEHFLYYWVLY